MSIWEKKMRVISESVGNEFYFSSKVFIFEFVVSARVFFLVAVLGKKVRGPLTSGKKKSRKYGHLYNKKCNGENLP